MGENKKIFYIIVLLSVVVLCTVSIYYFASKNKKGQVNVSENKFRSSNSIQDSVKENQQERKGELRFDEMKSESNSAQKELNKFKKEEEISIAKIVSLAKSKFKSYLPKIEKDHDGKLDLMDIYTGDFTGDDKPDVAIYFTLSLLNGGNATAGQGIAFYENTVNDVKVIAGFEPDYTFYFDKIANGKIYVFKSEYAENDARCCPSIKIRKVLTIVNGRVQERDAK
ncbi:MAG: hypothetical protein K1X86_00250 [Ignavibacteria bacterium]|nr:hypothetical protein [Ignavibacteria bacterium]